jgi:hypothetical protein
MKGSGAILGTVGRWFESNRPDHFSPNYAWK